MSLPSRIALTVTSSLGQPGTRCASAYEQEVGFEYHQSLPEPRHIDHILLAQLSKLRQNRATFSVSAPIDHVICL